MIHRNGSKLTSIEAERLEFIRRAVIAIRASNEGRLMRHSEVWAYASALWEAKPEGC